jgi:hypothetical protein
VTHQHKNFIAHNFQRNSRIDISKTTTAMDKVTNKNKRRGTSEQLHIAAWNVRGLSSKENKLENELLRAHADVAINLKQVRN